MEVMSENKGVTRTEFNKIKSIFWPIHSFELKKFIPTSLLLFCILFVYTMLKDLKDVFIQKFATCGGTELLPVLKLWFVMPAAIFFVVLFSTLVNKFGNKKTFYIMISIFTVFLTIFVLFLFPNARHLHASPEVVRTMQKNSPNFLYYVIPCLTNWSYTLFFVFAEMWGSVAIFSLFWQFANHITKKTEVKRFFGMFMVISYIGVVISGTMLRIMAKVRVPSAFQQNLKILIWVTIIFCLITMTIHYYINKVVMKDPMLCNFDEVKLPKAKTKISVFEGFKILFNSPYLLLVSVLILGYGISVNLFETVWKEQMRVSLVEGSDYSRMMGVLSQTTGLLTIFFSFINSNIIRRFKWRVPALITPAIMLILGAVFFAFVLIGRGGARVLFGMSVPMLAIWTGLFIDSLMRVAKYGLFDPTKSMAYIPLDDDAKTKGQAATEIIGGRLGKAGGSFTNYVLTNIVAVGSKVSAHLFTIIPIFALTVVIWIFSVFKLSTAYEAKVAQTSKP